MKKPKQILIETYQGCNLRCKGCFVTDSKPAHFPLEYWKKACDENTWNATMIPYMYGEPLLWKHLYEGTKYALDKGLRYYVATNGTIWNQDYFELICSDNRAYQIIFSVDGIPSPRYRALEACRPPSKWNEVLNNIRKFAELKAKKGDHIDLAIKLIKRGQDYQELEDFIWYWLIEEGTADYVAIGDLFTEDNNITMRHYPCWYMDDFYMLIRVDGTVVPCMYNREASKGYFPLGNYFDEDQTLLKLYNSDNFTLLRNRQNRGEFIGPCYNCSNPYNGFGFTGIVHSQIPERNKVPLYYHQDYYNQFFSLVNKREGTQYGNTGANK